MKKSDAGLTEEQWKELEELRRMPDREIDMTDIPVILDWKNIRRGTEPQPAEREVTILLSEDIIEWLQSLPKGQESISSCIHDILRAHKSQEANKVP